jgi:hypothetical protein
VVVESCTEPHPFFWTWIKNHPVTSPGPSPCRYHQSSPSKSSPPRNRYKGVGGRQTHATLVIARTQIVKMGKAEMAVALTQKRHVQCDWQQLTPFQIKGALPNKVVRLRLCSNASTWERPAAKHLLSAPERYLWQIGEVSNSQPCAENEQLDQLLLESNGFDKAQQFVTQHQLYRVGSVFGTRGSDSYACEVSRYDGSRSTPGRAGYTGGSACLARIPAVGYCEYL